MARVTVAVDPSLCVASGTCTDIAEDMFEIGDDGVAHPKSDTTEDSDEIREAADFCPVRAIVIGE